jgi:hypothetical protein
MRTTSTGGGVEASPPAALLPWRSTRPDMDLGCEAKGVRRRCEGDGGVRETEV